MEIIHIENVSLVYTKTGLAWTHRKEIDIPHMVNTFVVEYKHYFDMADVMDIELQMSLNPNNREAMNVQMALHGILLHAYPGKDVRVTSPHGWKRDSNIPTRDNHPDRKQLSIALFRRIVGEKYFMDLKGTLYKGKMDDVSDAFHIAEYALSHGRESYNAITQIPDWDPEQAT